MFPTPEDAPFPVQTSLYGASKLAGEGLISAYATGYDFTGLIFRFVSILGERYTHGHVFDFFRALEADPHALPVLGDGLQQKSYLYVQDCIAAMLIAVDDHDHDRALVYNLGHEETLLVDDSMEIITKRHGRQSRHRVRGWHARLGGRQSADSVGHITNPIARLEADQAPSTNPWNSRSTGSTQNQYAWRGRSLA